MISSEFWKIRSGLVLTSFDAILERVDVAPMTLRVMVNMPVRD
jgi:hypothetical protein